MVASATEGDACEDSSESRASGLVQGKEQCLHPIAMRSLPQVFCSTDARSNARVLIARIRGRIAKILSQKDLKMV